MAQLLSPISCFNYTQLHSDNTFSLKSMTQQDGIFVDFQTHFTHSNCQQSEIYFCALPAFNNDKQYFTPSFTLKINEKISQSNEIHEQQSLMRQLETFQSKKKSYCQSSNQQIYQAKPESNYCQICEERFDDYKKHIDHPIHAKKLKDGRIESDIQNLINNFQLKNSNSLKRTLSSLSNVEKGQKGKKCPEQTYFKGYKKIKKDTNDNQSSVLLSNLTSATNFSQ